MKALYDRLSNQPYILLTLAPLIWGFNVVIGRLAVDFVAPFTLTALRWMLMLVIVIPFGYKDVKRDIVTIRKYFWLLFAYGVTGFGFFNLLLYLSLNHTSAINVSLIQSAIPMIIIFLNWMLFREPLKVLQIFGLLLASIGVALIVTKGNIMKIVSLEINYGDGLAMMAVVLYALYSIGLRFKPQVSWLSFIIVAGFGASISAFPFMVYEVITKPWVIQLSIEAVAMIVYTAIFASVIAQISFAKGVSIIGANRAGLAINLVPVFGAILAVVILGEDFLWYHLCSLILVMSGIALSEYTNRVK